jgi:hypothetical protein
MIKDPVPEGCPVKPSTPADILGTISQVLQSYAEKDFAKVVFVAYGDSNRIAGQWVSAPFLQFLCKIQCTGIKFFTVFVSTLRNMSITFSKMLTFATIR